MLLGRLPQAKAGVTEDEAEKVVTRNVINVLLQVIYERPIQVKDPPIQKLYHKLVTLMAPLTNGMAHL